MSTPAATAAVRTERECLRAAGLIGLGAGTAAVLLWAVTFPGWPLAAGVMLSVFVVAAVLLVAGHAPPPAARWLRPIGVVAAIVLAVGGGIMVQRSAEAALEARFERSRPAFDAAVATAGPAPTTSSEGWLPYPGSCPEQLGSYGISTCHAFTGGFMFLQEREAFGDDAGFAYLPTGLPTAKNGLPASGFTHLDGPWYAWSCDC